jgi:uncharacterized tellurite resistance protein B-like protein
MPTGFLKKLLGASSEANLAPQDVRSAVAAVLVMAARADGAYAAEEQAMIDCVLAQRFGLSAGEAAALRADGESAEVGAVDLYQFTKAIKAAVPYEDRSLVLEAVWRVVLADAERNPMEDTLMRGLADRLGLTDRDSALARQRVSAAKR